MAQFDVPLPEITPEEFTRAWTRFELVAAAKEWSTERQAAILPTLLRGKLVDHYVELDATTRTDLKQLKTALMTKAGLTQDPLTAGKMFISRCQRPGEKAEDFADELRKLFGRAYPEEDITSDVLLQRFLTGLLAPVSRQVLLRGKPTTFAQAIKNATEIEYALNFENQSEPERDINAISQPNPMDHPKLAAQLQQTLEQMSKRLEALETRLQTDAPRYPAQNRRRENRRRYAPRMEQPCWECGELGHYKRDCPQLNGNGSTLPVGGWPKK